MMMGPAGRVALDVGNGLWMVMRRGIIPVRLHQTIRIGRRRVMTSRGCVGVWCL